MSTVTKVCQVNWNDKFDMENGTRLTDAVEKINNYCRTCAGLKIPLTDIFSDKGIQMRLNQQLNHLENIDQNESLSTKICMDCICDLKMSYKFFMQIKKAQGKLRSIYANLIAESGVRIKKEANDLDEQSSDYGSIIQCGSNDVKDGVMDDNTPEGSKKFDKMYEYNINVDSCIKIEPEYVVYDASLQSYIAIEKQDITKEIIEPPNALSRKRRHDKSTKSADSSNSEGIEPRMDYLNIHHNDNNISSIAVTKSEKYRKKLESKNIYCNPVVKSRNREAMIEAQIEQYKRKREKVLWGGTDIDNDCTLASTVAANTSKFDDGPVRFINCCKNLIGSSSFDDPLSFKFEDPLSLKVELTNNRSNESQIETNIEMEAFGSNEMHNNKGKETKETLSPLSIIQRKLEASRIKKELLQEDLDNSYKEGNIVKFSTVLREKEKNLEEFQKCLKQRDIIISRLKDENIISLNPHSLENHNIKTMHDKYCRGSCASTLSEPR